MRRKKKSLTFIIVLVLMFLGIGYAYLTTTLSINGVTDVDSNTWDVYWDNVQVTTGSVSGVQVTQAPTIDTTTKTMVSYHIRLAEPGEFYEFTIDAKNDGTIDAMIDSISSKLNGVEITTLPAYLKYTITYKYTLPVAEHQMIKAGTKETYKIRIEYRTDIDPDDLPSTAQSLSLTLGVNYIQADNNSVEVEDYFYGAQYINFVEGSNVPADAKIYNNYQDAIVEFGYPVFYKIVVKNELIYTSYVGIILDNSPLLLRGGGATYNEQTFFYNEDCIYYEENKNIMKAAYGESYCTEYRDGSRTIYRCEKNNLRASVSTIGIVSTVKLNPSDAGVCVFGDLGNTTFCAVEMSY